MDDKPVPYNSGNDPSSLHDAWKYLIPIEYNKRKLELNASGPILCAITNKILEKQLAGVTPSLLIIDSYMRKLLEKEVFGIDLEGSDQLTRVRGLTILEWPTDRFDVQ